MAKKSDSGEHPSVRDMYELLEEVKHNPQLDALAERSRRLVNSILVGVETIEELLERHIRGDKNES